MTQKKTMKRDGNERGRQTVDMVVAKDARLDAEAEDIARRVMAYKRPQRRSPILRPSISAAN